MYFSLQTLDGDARMTGHTRQTGPGAGAERGRDRMSCPHCGGMLAADLAAVMDELVCEKTVFEYSYCHCNDVDSSMLVPKEKVPAAKQPSDCGTSEGKEP